MAVASVVGRGLARDRLAADLVGPAAGGEHADDDPGDQHGRREPRHEQRPAAHERGAVSTSGSVQPSHPGTCAFMTPTRAWRSHRSGCGPSMDVKVT